MSTRITTVSETTSLKTDRIEIIFWTPASEVEPHIAGHTFDARIGHASFRCIPHDPGGVHLLLFDRFEVSPHTLKMEAARVAQLNPTPEELAYTPSHPSEWTFFYLYFFEHALVLAVESGDPINFENALALYTQIQSGDRVHFSASDPNSSYSAYIVISASTRARLAGAFAPYLPSSQ